MHLLPPNSFKTNPITFRIAAFLAIVFGWSWISWIVAHHVIGPGFNDKTARSFLIFLFIGLYGPFVGAIVTTWYFDGFREVVHLLKKYTIWKAPLVVYLVTFLLPIIIPAITVIIYHFLYGNVGRVDMNAGSLIPLYLWAALRGGPMGEELGWRGFLLPELQRSFSPVASSLLIGFIWTCWHIPLFYLPVGTAISGGPVTLGPVIFFYVFVTCLACIYTLLVNRSQGSVFIAVLIHLFINAGILMLFFPDLVAHSKQLYYLSAPVYIVITAFLCLKTRLR